MEENPQETEDDGAFISLEISPQPLKLETPTVKHRAESLKNHLATVRKWKYRKRTCKFE